MEGMIYWDACWAFVCFNWDRVCIYDARGRSFLLKTLKPPGNQHTLGHRYTASSEWCNLLCFHLCFHLCWWQVRFLSTKTTDECFLPPSCAHMILKASMTKVTFPATTVCLNNTRTDQELPDQLLFTSNRLSGSNLTSVTSLTPWESLRSHESLIMWAQGGRSTFR